MGCCDAVLSSILEFRLDALEELDLCLYDLTYVESIVGDNLTNALYERFSVCNALLPEEQLPENVSPAFTCSLRPSDSVAKSTICQIFMKLND